MLYHFHYISQKFGLPINAFKRIQSFVAETTGYFSS